MTFTKQEHQKNKEEVTIDMDENSKYINEFYQKNKGEIIANKSKSETQNNSGKNLGKIG